MSLKFKPSGLAAAAAVLAVSACSSAQFADFNANIAEMTRPEPAGEAQLKVTETEGSGALAYAAPVGPVDAERAGINALIERYAAHYNVPSALVHKVVRRESTYNPRARNGVHIGLMQLNPRTARTMGYSGPDSGLYDPETNLKYGVKYLAGAYLVSKGDQGRADRLYQSGYYYHAKRQGLLEETGLRG